MYSNINNTVKVSSLFLRDSKMFNRECSSIIHKFTNVQHFCSCNVRGYHYRTSKFILGTCCISSVNGFFGVFNRYIQFRCSLLRVSRCHMSPQTSRYTLPVSRCHMSQQMSRYTLPVAL